MVIIIEQLLNTQNYNINLISCCDTNCLERKINAFSTVLRCNNKNSIEINKIVNIINNY